MLTEDRVVMDVQMEWMIELGTNIGGGLFKWVIKDKESERIVIVDIGQV